MKAYVTGATGFIGSHLVEQLVDKGYHVMCLVRKTSNLRWLDYLRTAKSPQVELVMGDLHDSNALARQVRDADLVFHLAGLTKAPDAATYDHVNAEGTAHLIKACLDARVSLDRFVYCSSLAAVGPSSTATPNTEDVTPQPLTDYGSSKLKGEMIVREYADRLPITIIRPPAVYGPRDADIFLFFQMINRGVIPILGEADKLLSLVHVKDLVIGIYSAAVSGCAVGETYFLTDGDIHTWLGIERIIADVLEKRPFKVKVPLFLLDFISIFTEAAAKITHQAPTLNRQRVRDLKQRFWICDSTKAQNELGYRPTYCLQKGMQETADWYRAHGWL